MPDGMINDGTILGRWKRSAPLPVVMAGTVVALTAFVVTEPAHWLLQKVLPDA